MEFHFHSGKNLDVFSLKFWDLSGAKVCQSCRSRKTLQNEYLVAIVAVHTAENEPLKVWGIFHSFFIRLLTAESQRQKRASRRAASCRAGCTVRRRMKNEWNHPQILRGSFSAVWIATIASKVTFYSIFQALQDKQTFAPLTFQIFQIFANFGDF